MGGNDLGHDQSDIIVRHILFLYQKGYRGVSLSKWELGICNNVVLSLVILLILIG